MIHTKNYFISQSLLERLDCNVIAESKKRINIIKNTLECWLYSIKEVSLEDKKELISSRFNPITWKFQRKADVSRALLQKTTKYIFRWITVSKKLSGALDLKELLNIKLDNRSLWKLAESNKFLRNELIDLKTKSQKIPCQCLRKDGLQWSKWKNQPALWVNYCLDWEWVEKKTARKLWYLKPKK